MNEHFSQITTRFAGAKPRRPGGSRPHPSPGVMKSWACTRFMFIRIPLASSPLEKAQTEGVSSLLAPSPSGIGLYKGMHTFFTVAKKRGKCFSSMALSRSAP